VKIGHIIISFILTISILFNSLHVAFTYAYYYLDPIDFIEKLCENKDKPELQCNGKCHLKKVVEKNNNDGQAPIKAIDFNRIVLYVINQFEYKLTTIQSKKTELIRFDNLYTYIRIHSFYRPPQL